MEKETESTSFRRVNAMELGVDTQAITPMPPEFQLKHPRRIRSSSWFTQPDGQKVHFYGYTVPTPADEAMYRIRDPENGLHPEDLQTFRASTRGPVTRTPMERFFDRFKFW